MASKMYILLRDSVEPGYAALACAHAALGGYLTFVKAEMSAWGSDRDRNLAFGGVTSTQIWADESFRKVACSVTDEQFEKAKTFGTPGVDFQVMTESGLGGMEVAIVFRPKESWDSFFKGLPLWGKNKVLVNKTS